MNIDQTSNGSGNIEWSELQEKIQGHAVSRGSMAYEDDRRAGLWNARKPDRFPDAIVQAISATDVQEAVRFARRYRLRVSVRGGGHHFNGPSLTQGGLLIDLQALKKISVDPETKTAAAQPGVTAGELMAALIPHVLAFPVGHCRTVPLGGFLLAGGFGWNGGHWGPACLSVTGIDMVDANGETVIADAGRNPDLYWAARHSAIPQRRGTGLHDSEANTIPTASFFPSRNRMQALSIIDEYRTAGKYIADKVDGRSGIP